MVTRWAIVVAAGALFASGCSSSSDEVGTVTSTTATATSTSDGTAAPRADSSEPEDDLTEGSESPDGESDARRAGEVTLIEAGVEPRAELSLTSDARSRLAVDASDTLTLTIGANTTDQGATAACELDLDLTVSDTGAELLVAPSTVSVDGAALGAEELGTWRWVLDRNGRVQRVVSVGWSEQVDGTTIDLLTTNHLVLVTPTEAVGAGAVWSQSLDRQSDAQLVFTLTEVTDSDLEVTIELIAPFDEGVATMVASGTYDRATLLARGLTTESGLEVTSPVTDNGELVELTGVQRSFRTLVEPSDSEASG
jgi:hypothetical protein